MPRETITDEEVQFFLDNGYLVVRDAIDRKVIDQVRDAADALQDRYIDYRKEEGVHYTSPGAKSFDEMMDGTASAQGDAVLWRIDDLEKRFPAVEMLKRLPFVHNAMEALLGAETLQYNESFVTKPPRVGQPVLWHQDPSFKVKCTPDPISTIDIYLDKTDEGNGCIWVVPGTHKKGVIDVKSLMDQHGFDLPDAIPVCMEPGDVAFHDNGCLHGSKANTSDRLRRIVYLAFQTLPQAKASDKFDDAFIQQRIDLFAQYRAKAFA
ncbi:MAG: phytanoyl-CoA dioxygenase family protein [Planctomycetes bacterium]|nr:phytanoyl-CoA dioxygenase family protein [Planctomycetota bacterium]